MQLIYIKDGQEETFNRFENIAIPIINKYNGKLLLRVKPEPENFIEAGIEKPFEIHLIEFETGQDFENFKLDEERQNCLHLKEQSIRSTFLIQGTEI